MELVLKGGAYELFFFLGEGHVLVVLLSEECLFHPGRVADHGINC